MFIEAYLIDSETKKVHIVDFNPDVHSISSILGTDDSLIEMSVGEDLLFLKQEMDESVSSRFFSFDDGLPFSGNGVIVGFSESGFIRPTMGIKSVIERVSFLDKWEIDLVKVYSSYGRNIPPLMLENNFQLPF